MAEVSTMLPVKKTRRGRISVVVRKRPQDGEGEDCVEVRSPTVHVGATKLRVDLTEYVESHAFEFDHAFDATANNAEVYKTCVLPLLDVVYKGASSSVFAFGQTGSGKTHTMIGTPTDPGIYVLASRDIFSRLTSTQRVFVSLYEIYCNSLFDLLNGRRVVIAREDGNKRVNICGLTWHEVDSVATLVAAIERGTDQRRTGSTSANEYSSRSHAIMTLTVKDDASPRFCGCLNIVDLAGSERAADTSSNDRQTRLEGAEINKSLLALKECIRGLDERKKHIPFRHSKLTEVLRESFGGSSRTVMIATISPNMLNVEHTMNTLRYAFRVKGLSVESIVPSKDRAMNNAAPPPMRMDRVVGHGRQRPSIALADLNIDDDATESPAEDDGTAAQGQAPPRHRPPHKERTRQTRNGAVNSVANSNNRAESPPLQPLNLHVAPIGHPAIALVEARINAQVRELRDEVRQMREHKSRDDQRIAELSSMNRELLQRMDELCRLAAANNHRLVNHHAGGGPPVKL